MTRLPILGIGALLGTLSLVALRSAPPAAQAETALPAPALDVAPGGPALPASALQTAVFAGGCFWGVQGVFQHMDGVVQAVSGYSGGDVADPGYARVSTGATGHAEAVRVTFDPARVSYGALLQVFFSVALDPTQVDGQGPDQGTQYRSELFVDGPEQAAVARAYVAQLDAARVFAAPVATRIDPLGAFYPAEAYHQDYLELHPDSPYIARFDMPKVQALQRLFPARWQAAPATVHRATAAG
jgi:peptide-methionine (S)-S-oxide reductase